MWLAALRTCSIARGLTSLREGVDTFLSSSHLNEPLVTSVPNAKRVNRNLILAIVALIVILGVVAFLYFQSSSHPGTVIVSGIISTSDGSQLFPTGYQGVGYLEFIPSGGTCTPGNSGCTAGVSPNGSYSIDLANNQQYLVKFVSGSSGQYSWSGPELILSTSQSTYTYNMMVPTSA